jgi:hypothetical protein
MAHTIALLECSKNVKLILRSNIFVPDIAIVNDKREGWPATQTFPYRCSISAEKLQVETEW